MTQILTTTTKEEGRRDQYKWMQRPLTMAWWKRMEMGDGRWEIWSYREGRESHLQWEMAQISRSGGGDASIVEAMKNLKRWNDIWFPREGSRGGENRHGYCRLVIQDTVWFTSNVCWYFSPLSRFAIHSVVFASGWTFFTTLVCCTSTTLFLVFPSMSYQFKSLASSTWFDQTGCN